MDDIHDDFSDTVFFGQASDGGLNVIRIETALSRYPIHRLAKRGDVRVEIRRKEGGQEMLWKVSYNSDYGQPGPLAYKLDTLLVNRRIEEAGKPVPKIIRLGSLQDMAAHLDLGRNTNAVKHALLQNAFAAITARVVYKATDGRERTLEAAFTRYSVVFTGEALPSGSRADGVCLILNDIYMEVLNTALTRPLDYEYLKELAPGSQRFYEILSYQMYAALRHERARARLLYSEYCLYSTQTRYHDFDHVKKQMYKIHQPHLLSGYLAKIEYQPTADEEGRADWEMLYTPGEKARAEYAAFARRGTGASAVGQRIPAPLHVPASPPRPPIEKPPAASPLPPDALVEALVDMQLNRGDAVRFAAEKPEVCRRQIAGLKFLLAQDKAFTFRTSQGAYLRDAIVQDYAPPAEMQHQRQQQQNRQGRSNANALESLQEAHRGRFWSNYVRYVTHAVQSLTEAENKAFQQFLEQERQTRAKYERLKLKTPLKVFDTPEARAERLVEFFKDRDEHPIHDFWEWDRRHNPERFAAPGEET